VGAFGRTKMAVGKRDSESFIGINDAYSEFSRMLSASDIPLEIGNFDDFVQNIFAKSYPQYDMNTWHVRLLSSKVDEAFKNPENAYLLAVLPRYHLKSTILGYGSAIYRMLTAFGEGLYISYKEDLANIHSYHIKKAIYDNPELFKIMQDLSPQSDMVINYRVGKRKLKIYTAGVMSVKRGLHTDTIVIGDDLMGDVLNPMVMTDIEKTKKIFDAEIMQIPNRGCPLFVYGTIISDDDLFFHLKDKPRFKERTLWLPAEHPDDTHEVLWEAKYPMSWLEQQKADIGWKAFSTEFLLTPLLSTEAFISRDEIVKCLDKTLKSQSIYKPYHRQFGGAVVAGFDVGKRKSPSHFAVFEADEDDNLIMICQEFWDGIDYDEQIKRIETAVENLDIDKLYFDNTRSELEDRGLPVRQCVPIKFTGKGERPQMSFAVDLARKIETHSIKLIDDDRFISQITCVSNTLKAPETPKGHGDSFWSVALACGVFQDYFAKDRKKRFGYLGDIQDTLRSAERPVIKNQNTGFAPETMKKFHDEKKCRVCGSRKLEPSDGGMKCSICQTEWQGKR